MLTNDRASSEQKSAAVVQVGTAVVTDAARKTARKNAPKVKEALKKVAPVAVPIAIGTAAVYAGGKALTANRKREANRFADKELAKTKKKMGKQWDPRAEKILRQQYYDAALKRPVTNSYSGK